MGRAEQGQSTGWLANGFIGPRSGPHPASFPNFAKIDSEIDARKFDSLYDFFLYYIRPIWASPWAGLGFLILAQPSLSRKIPAHAYP